MPEWLAPMLALLTPFLPLAGVVVGSGITFLTGLLLDRRKAKRDDAQRARDELNKETEFRIDLIGNVLKASDDRVNIAYKIDMAQNANPTGYGVTDPGYAALVHQFLELGSSFSQAVFRAYVYDSDGFFGEQIDALQRAHETFNHIGNGEQLTTRIEEVLTAQDQLFSIAKKYASIRRPNVIKLPASK